MGNHITGIEYSEEGLLAQFGYGVDSSIKTVDPLATQESVKASCALLLEKNQTSDTNAHHQSVKPFVSGIMTLSRHRLHKAVIFTMPFFAVK